MKNSNNGTDTSVMSRRKALSRLGGVAIMVYSVPALTTLSMAHAASSASAASKASAASVASEASAASVASEASAASVASAASGPSSSKGSGPEFDACGTENLADTDYVQCLTDNGFEVPA